jgi:hypothetical protein
MQSRKNINIVITLVIFVLALTACAQPTPAVPATLDPQDLEATISAAETNVVREVLAQLTETALANPTDAPTEVPPTAVPTEVPPTAEPTQTAAPVVVPTATKAVISSGSAGYVAPVQNEYQCQIISISPVAGTNLNQREDFDFSVTVKNTGTKTWDQGEFDYRFVSGTKMHKGTDFMDMPATVQPGQQVSLTIDMLAPSISGNAFAVWNIVSGDKTACSLVLDIYVK